MRVCIAVGLVFLLVRQVDWIQFDDIIAEHGLKLYLVLVPVAGLGWLVYAWRWRLLLLPLELTPPFRELISDSLVGLFYGLFVPTGLAGDAVRATRLGNRHHDIRKTLLSVAVDRIVGLLSVLLLFGTRLLRNDQIRREVRLSWIWWAIGAALTLAVVLFMGGKHLVNRVGGWTPQTERGCLFKHRLLDRLAGQVDRLLDLVREYNRAWHLVALGILVSVIYQLLVTFVYYIGGLIFGIRIGFGDYVWIVALVSLAQVMPVTIAGLGVREGLLAVLLGQYGVSATTSVALSLSVFGVTLLFGIFGGILELTSAYRRSMNR